MAESRDHAGLPAGGKASHFIGIATDITQSVEDARIKREMQARIDSQERERERLTLELRLAQKLEALGRLAAGVAHEINTPIQYISDNVAFMRDSLDDLAKVVNAYRFGATQGNETAEEVELGYLMGELPKSMDRAQEGVRRVANIVRAMKEFSHPGSRREAWRTSTVLWKGHSRSRAANTNTWPPLKHAWDHCRTSSATSASSTRCS